MDSNRIAEAARALLAAGRADEAIGLIAPALATTTPPVRLLVLQAQALQRLGRLDDASACAARALAAAPHDLGARLTAADLALYRGALPQAIAHLEAAQALDPHAPAIAVELARLRLQAGDPAGALDAAEAALARAPADVSALRLHAQASLRCTDGARAERSLSALLGLSPQDPELWRLRGEAAWLAGRSADALQHARAALALRPDDVRTLDLAVRAVDASNQPLAERLALHERLVAAAPNAPRLVALAVVHWNRGDYASASAALAQAVAADPDNLVARWALMNTPPTLVPRDAAAREAYRAHWEAGLVWFEQRLAQAPVDASAALTALQLATNFFWHYTGEPIDALQRRYAAVVGGLAAAALPAWTGRSAPAPRRGDARLRVAIVSAHLHAHTINRLFGALLAGLPTRAFECAAFQISTPQGTASTPSQPWSAHWSGPRPLQEWLALIAGWQPDILVLPEIGMHPLSQIFACVRLAPVQVALWGHPIAPRMPAIDRWCGCAAMQPEAAPADPERIDLAGIGACFDPPTEAPTPPPTLATWAARHPVYGVLQSVYKLKPEFDAALARILAAVPGAVVHATPSAHAHICAELRARWATALAAAGVDARDALGLVAGLPRREFLGLVTRLDVNLDSHDWSGGNTTLEALWFDVPTVTLPGTTLRSRHTAAMLAALELPQLIARDVDDYVRIAVDLGRDDAARAAVREHIARHKQRLYQQRAPGDSLAAALWALCGRDPGLRPW